MVRGLTEGQFVVFRTHSLTPPVYLNAYLALRDKRTISTLFPMPSDQVGREQTLRDRTLAQRLRDQVGQDPRVVFALRPPSKEERAEKHAASTAETQATSSVERETPEEHRQKERWEESHLPAYVDSPTVETWARPLTAAPLKLLCRTDSTCTALVRAREVTKGEREKAIRSSRQRAVAALEEQTTIPRRGAVILPIAIYK